MRQTDRPLTSGNAVGGLLVGKPPRLAFAECWPQSTVGNTPKTPQPGPHTRAGRPVVGHPALIDGPQACSGVRCPALAPELDGDEPGAAPDADLAGSGLAFGMTGTSQLLVDWLIHGGGPLQDEVWV